MHPVEERFVPTPEQVRKVWMDRMSYSNVPEKIEYELGFEVFVDRLTGRRPCLAEPNEPSGSHPEARRPSSSDTRRKSP